MSGSGIHLNSGDRKKDDPDFWINRSSIVAYLWTTNYAAVQQKSNFLISLLKTFKKNFFRVFLLRCGIISSSLISNFSIKSPAKREGGMLMASLIKPLNVLVVCAAFAFIAAVLLGAL